MRYLASRVLAVMPTLIFVLVITFVLGHLAPGDPIVAQVGEGQVVNAIAEAQLRQQLGLNLPLSLQFANYLVGLVHGNFGVSLSMAPGFGVASLIAQSLPPSLEIGGAAIVMVTLVGVPMGVVAALNKNSWLDNILVALATIPPTVPTFVLAPLLLILFVLDLHWIHFVTGWRGLWNARAILPVLLMTVSPLLVIVRQTRIGMVGALSEDFVRTARAKGLSETVVIGKHVFRTAISPLITSLGLIAGSLLTGSVFVESIFGIPGFGNLVYQSFVLRDYPLIVGSTLCVAFLFIVINLVTDLMYRVANPRVRLG